MNTDYINPDTVNSLHELLRLRSQKSPHGSAYQYFNRQTSHWDTIDWQSVYTQSRQWASALAHEDLQAGDRVAILIKNSLEWVLFEQACFANHLVVVPLYLEDRAENLAYVIQDAGVKLLLIEGDKHLEMISSVAEKIDCLDKIICLDKPTIELTSINTANLNTWLDKPEKHDLTDITDRHTLATIVYTSGTTGKSKGVMLSHDNILQNTWAGLNSIKVYPSDNFLSFLPISHMLERTVGYYMPMMSGALVSFSRSIPELAADMVTLNPSVMITVPRIFERVYNKIEETISQKPRLIQWLFARSIDIAWDYFQYQQHKTGWSPLFILLPLFNLLFHRKIRDKFGKRFRFAISGGAPLDYNVARLFISLKIIIAQGYGLTEFSPVISVNRLDDNDPRSVGRPLPGVEIRTNENQELEVKGKCVMQGYWNNLEATQVMIDEQGWLSTGDKVNIIDNRIYITGRIKDIIVLSTGEKVPPCEIEQSILQDPAFENIVVVGEQRPYLSALVIPNFDHVEKMVNDTDGFNEQLLERINHKMSAFPGYARIHKVSICKEAWTVENGMLTPTLKPKRQYIIDQNKNIIDDMYN